MNNVTQKVWAAVYAKEYQKELHHAKESYGYSLAKASSRAARLAKTAADLAIATMKAPNGQKQK